MVKKGILGDRFDSIELTEAEYIALVTKTFTGEEISAVARRAERNSFERGYLEGMKIVVETVREELIDKKYIAKVIDYYHGNYPETRG